MRRDRIPSSGYTPNRMIIIPTESEAMSYLCVCVYIYILLICIRNLNCISSYKGHPKLNQN